MYRLLLTIAITAALITAASAQTVETTKPPDLSGKWKLNHSKSTLKSKLPSDTLTITTDGDKIQFHHSGDPKDRQETFIADGEKHPLGIWLESEPPQFVMTRWDQSTLVIEFINHGPNSTFNSVQRWSLSPDGKLLTMQIPGPNLLYVYDKR
jgi:hypothetical protein